MSARVLPVVALVAALACGRDYAPPEVPATGVPAAPVGQVLDVDLSLPAFVTLGTRGSGLQIELRIDLDGTGHGDLEGRFTIVHARLGAEPVTVEDLSSGRITVRVTPDRWFVQRIGPLRVNEAAFEILLDGKPERGARHVVGRAFETRHASQGSFQAWRRQRFLVAGSDFFSTTGRVSEVALVRGSELRVRTALAPTSSDAVLRVTGNAAFVVNRLSFDNLQRLDPRESFATSWQRSVGIGANPHDVLLVGEERGYVTRYEPPFDDVAVFDPHSGKLLGSVPLGTLADNPDGTPRPERMREVDGTIFVGLQDIDRSFSRYFEGKLAVVDPALDEVVGSIPLGGKNPGAIEVVRGADDRARLYVALAGIFPGLLEQELSGGVAVVDPLARVLERQAIDDDALGGNVAALAMASDALGYVVAVDASFTNRVVAFDPVSGVPLRTVFHSTELVPEIEVDSDGIVAVPDRSILRPRLCLWRVPSSPAGLEAALGCADLDLPPFSLEPLD